MFSSGTALWCCLTMLVKLHCHFKAGLKFHQSLWFHQGMRVYLDCEGSSGKIWVKGKQLFDVQVRTGKKEQFQRSWKCWLKKELSRFWNGIISTQLPLGVMQNDDMLATNLLTAFSEATSAHRVRATLSESETHCHANFQHRDYSAHFPSLTWNITVSLD